jgi:hypothetical protein
MGGLLKPSRRGLITGAAALAAYGSLARAGINHGAAGGGGGGTTSAVVWDTTTLGSLLSPSNGNKTLIHTGADSQNTAVANTALGATNVYWEVVLDAYSGNAFSPIRGGVAMQDTILLHAGGIGNIGADHDGGLSIFNGQVQSEFKTEAGNFPFPGPPAVTDDAPSTTLVAPAGTMGFAWIGSTKRLFITGDGTNYYGRDSVTDNPATATGGMDCSTAAGTLYPAITLWKQNDQVTWNAGATVFTMPAGFSRL